MKNPLNYIVLIAIFCCSCEVKPQKINYNEDACHYCKMSIVDRQHAAEIVSEKGKAFKYDAIECMMNNYRDWTEVQPELFLVNDYLNPGKLINAKEAHYLISENIPSPMGEFLTAFSDKSEREEFVNGSAKILDWQELKNHYSIPD